MVTNLLPLKTNLDALQTMQTFWSKEYFEIAIDLITSTLYCKTTV